MLALLERERPKYKIKVRENERMIKSFKIQNFRAFESIQLKNLKKVNIIVGDNASGKTALLEALFLLGGLSTELIMRLKGWRLMPEVTITDSQETFNEIFGDYFYGFDTSKTIYLEAKGTIAESRDVKIYFQEPESTEIKVGKMVEQISTIHPLNFKGHYDRTKEFHVKAVMEDSKLKLPRFPITVKSCFFPSGMKTSPKEAADRFSSLDATGKLQEVIDVFIKIYPFIEDLSIITRNGEGMIWAKVKGQKQKMPITLISEGVNKLLGLLLAIKFYPYSYILIDEIENGFYYKKMPEIWRVLYELAVECNVQLFVSTHSMECLRAAEETLMNNKEHFSLLRTVKENGKAIVREISGEWLFDALESDLEVR